MNNYNENLHADIVTLLSSQELDQKKLKARLDASMLTLYHAEGAEIAAKEKLDDTVKQYKDKQTINNQAVECNSLSKNLQLSANQQKQYIETTVTNSAVAASNIQIAANAVVRLTSDMGSIFSIINAADFDSQIYWQCKDACDLINETASNAETASLLAMKASTAIAEVTAATIADKAKSACSSIDNLLKITTSDLATVVATVETNYASLALAKVTTKLSQGITEYNEVEYNAAKKADLLNNKELNSNLTVQENIKNASCTVSFDCYKSPFSFLNDNPLNTIKKAILENPVKSYNIIVVKESKKSMFSIANAEELLADDSRFIEILPATGTTSVTISDTSVTIAANNTQEIAKKKVAIAKEKKDLRDSDDKPITKGEKYVAFVCTVFTEEFKKVINIFDDYLSAPSGTFCLRDTLLKATFQPYDKSDTLLKFTLKDQIPDMEYRLIFLPYPDDLPVNNSKKLTPPFLFNLKLAENIPYGNYIELQNPHNTNIDIHTVNIPSNATDNFGTPLKDQALYIPVILSYYNGSSEIDRKKFINALSDWKSTVPFTYLEAQK